MIDFFDATGRKLEVGQWVVQPFLSSRVLRTRIVYVEELLPSKEKIRLIKFNYFVPGDWEFPDAPYSQRGSWIVRLPEATWDRSHTLISKVETLTIIPADVALSAQPALAEWIETHWNGDPAQPEAATAKVI